MNDEWVDDDELLLAALGDALLAREAVPDWFITAGKDSFAWYGVDAELARLAADSALLATSSTTRAEPAEVRALTFAARELTIQLELAPHGLHGQLVPPQAGEVELELDGGGSVRVTADELGYFAFGQAPTTTFRLRCRTVRNAVVSTSWITL
jgi:hypothetical protein